MNIEQTIRDYIQQIVHMSLGTCKDGRPWVCEVHFAYDDDLNLYFRSLTSRRHSQEIAENPQVSGNIVRQFKLGEVPLGVYFEGVAKLLPAGDEQNEAFARISKRLGKGPEALEEAKSPEGHQFYKISVQNWYVFGKFGEAGAQKYALPWNGDKK